MRGISSVPSGAVGDDALEAVVPPGGALCADAQLADRERHVVRNNDDMVRGDSVIRRGGSNGVAREVHEGLRFHKEDLFAAELARRGQRVEAELGDLDVFALLECVRRPETNVVAGAVVFFAGVAEKNDEPGNAAAWLLEDHNGKSPFTSLSAQSVGPC